MKIKGAIFDLDGTLLDTMPFWEDLGAEYLRQKGYTPPKNINETLKTMSLDQGASYLKKTCSLPESEEVIVREIISLIEDLYRFRVPLKAHVVPFLQRLSENRVKMCIATATDHALAKAALERLEVIEYFQFIFTCREAGLGKDQPEFFLKVLDRLKTPKRKPWSLRMLSMPSRAPKQPVFLWLQCTMEVPLGASRNRSQRRSLSEFFCGMGEDRFKIPVALKLQFLYNKNRISRRRK